MDWTTERLQLDALREDDAAALFGYRADPAVARYQGWIPSSVEDALQFIRTQRAQPADARGGWQQRAIRLRDDGTLIGDLGWCVPASQDDAYEFGISLAPACQHQGYARETLTALFGRLFAEGARRLVASVDPRNEGSMRMLQAMGMRQEAHFRESFQLRGEWVDDVVFALLAREWPPQP